MTDKPAWEVRAEEMAHVLDGGTERLYDIDDVRELITIDRNDSENPLRLKLHITELRTELDAAKNEIERICMAWKADKDELEECRLQLDAAKAENERLITLFESGSAQITGAQSSQRFGDALKQTNKGE